MLITITGAVTIIALFIASIVIARRERVKALHDRPQHHANGDCFPAPLFGNPTRHGAASNTEGRSE